MHRLAARTFGYAVFFVASSAGAARAQLSIAQSSGCPALQTVSAAPVIQSSATPVSDSAPAPTLRQTGNPDIVLLLGFSADEVRFNSPPNASIRLCWGSDSLHIVERRNLPSPVVAGTTYRNVYIAAELRAYLNPECLTQTFGVSAVSPPSTTNAGCAALGINTSSGIASKPPPASPTTVSRRPQ